MKFSLNSVVAKELKRIKSKEPQLYNKIRKQLKLFSENPNHPSLRNHKLKGNLSNTRSVSIDESRRMLYYTNKNEEAVFFAIGTHDEVYRKG